MILQTASDKRFRLLWPFVSIYRNRFLSEDIATLPPVMALRLCKCDDDSWVVVHRTTE